MYNENTMACVSAIFCIQNTTVKKLLYYETNYGGFL